MKKKKKELANLNHTESILPHDFASLKKMRMNSLLEAALLIWVASKKIQAKAVFAHYMVFPILLLHYTLEFILAPFHYI